MLGGENRVPAPGCLLSVLLGVRRRETFPNKVAGVNQHDVDPLASEVVVIRAVQMNARSEF
jgi:hypothetical protein